MHNILEYITYNDKEAFSDKLKQIWLAPDAEIAHKIAEAMAEEYVKWFPKAIETLEN